MRAQVDDAWVALPAVYTAAGLSAIVFGPIAGRLNDGMGRLPIFAAGSVLTAVIVLVYTRLGVTPLWCVIALNVLLFAGNSARMVSAQTLMSTVPDPRSRGAFMAVSASVQQVSGGMASAAAGLIVVQTPSGTLHHYERLGYVVTAALAITVTLIFALQRAVSMRAALPNAEPSGSA